MVYSGPGEARHLQIQLLGMVCSDAEMLAKMFDMMMARKRPTIHDTRNPELLDQYAHEKYKDKRRALMRKITRQYNEA